MRAKVRSLLVLIIIACCLCVSYTAWATGDDNVLAVTVRVTSGPTPSKVAVGDSTHPATGGLDISATDSTLQKEADDQGAIYSWDYDVYRKDKSGDTYQLAGSLASQAHVTLNTSTSKSPTYSVWFSGPGYWEIKFHGHMDFSYYDNDTGLTTTYSGTGDCQIDVIAVGVKQVIVDGSTPPDTGPALALVGKSVTLRAIPDPDDTTFPSGKPVWTFDSKPAGSAVANPTAGNPTATITPDKAGDYVVKAASGTSTATFTIQAITLDSVTATEVYNTTPMTNSITVLPTDTNKVLFVRPGNKFQISANITPATNTSALARVLFTVDGTGASPASGNFSGQPKMITIQPDIFYIVRVGWDQNKDGTLQSTEESIVFSVSPVILGTSVSAQRLSAPSESYYSLKSGEHFEVGGNFQYKTVGGSSAPQLPNNVICWQFWDSDGFNDLISSGSGREFNLTLPSGTAEGWAFVTFYIDLNGNGSFDSGEPYLNSEDFWVQRMKVYSVATQYSNLIPTAINATIIQARFTEASNVLLKKDSTDDFRACVGFFVTGATAFTAGASRPDPCDADVRSDCSPHYDATDICFVDTLLHAGGVTWDNDWSKIIIDWSTSFTWLERAIAHEFGHGVGLHHAGHASPQIMQGGVLSGADNELKKEDVDSYDQ